MKPVIDPKNKITIKISTAILGRHIVKTKLFKYCPYLVYLEFEFRRRPLRTVRVTQLSSTDLFMPYLIGETLVAPSQNYDQR